MSVERVNLHPFMLKVNFVQWAVVARWLVVIDIACGLPITREKSTQRVLEEVFRRL